MSENTKLMIKVEEPNTLRIAIEVEDGEFLSAEETERQVKDHPRWNKKIEDMIALNNTTIRYGI